MDELKIWIATRQCSSIDYTRDHVSPDEQPQKGKRSMTTTFADRLKMLRLRKGYGQKDLAAKVGVAKNTVSVWERGKRTPDVVTCQDIAFALV